jgi:hypothetical protein
MPSLLPRQRVVNTAANDHQFDQFQGFSRPPLLVLAAYGEASSQSLSDVCRPLSDCTCGRLKRRFPKREHRHDCVERHDLWMWRALCNTHIGHHREQRLHDEITALHVDMEYEQIYLGELPMVDPIGHPKNALLRQTLQSSWHGDSGQGLGRGVQ